MSIEVPRVDQPASHRLPSVVNRPPGGRVWRCASGWAGSVVASRVRVREVADPKCRCAGAGRPRWILESPRSALPGPSHPPPRMGQVRRVGRRRGVVGRWRRRTAAGEAALHQEDLGLLAGFEGAARLIGVGLAIWPGERRTAQRVRDGHEKALPFRGWDVGKVVPTGQERCVRRGLRSDRWRSVVLRTAGRNNKGDHHCLGPPGELVQWSGGILRQTAASAQASRASDSRYAIIVR